MLTCGASAGRQRLARCRDPTRDVAVNALWDDLSRSRRRSARLWPQTEHLTAALVLGDEAQGLRAARGLAQYLECPGSRRLARQAAGPMGGFVDEPAPATSFYHLMVAVLELTAHLGSGCLGTTAINRPAPQRFSGRTRGARRWTCAHKPTDFPSRRIRRQATPGRSYGGHTPDEALQVARQARAAFDGWRRTDIAERAALMRRAASVLRAREAEFCALMTDEMGKTLTEGLAEIGKCAGNWDYLRRARRRVPG